MSAVDEIVSGPPDRCSLCLTHVIKIQKRNEEEGKKKKREKNLFPFPYFLSFACGVFHPRCIGLSAETSCVPLVFF